MNMPFNDAMKWTIAALLQSPQFLYRSELGVNNGNGLFELTDARNCIGTLLLVVANNTKR